MPPTRAQPTYKQGTETASHELPKLTKGGGNQPRKIASSSARRVDKLRHEPNHFVLQKWCISSGPVGTDKYPTKVNYLQAPRTPALLQISPHMTTAHRARCRLLTKLSSTLPCAAGQKIEHLVDTICYDEAWELSPPFCAGLLEAWLKYTLTHAGIRCARVKPNHKQGQGFLILCP